MLIQMSFDDLVKQAPMTIEHYLRSVVVSVDAVFGKNYSRSNPAFIASLIHTCAMDFNTSSTGKIIEHVGGHITDALREGHVPARTLVAALPELLASLGKSSETTGGTD